MDTDVLPDILSGEALTTLRKFSSPFKQPPPLSKNPKQNNTKQKDVIFAANWQSSLDNAIHLCSVCALLRLTRSFNFHLACVLQVYVTKDGGGLTSQTTLRHKVIFFPPFFLWFLFCIRCESHPSGLTMHREVCRVSLMLWALVVGKRAESTN